MSRFLSPDPFVQSSFAQSFNRYSYVINNPLKFIDPDGYRYRYRDFDSSGNSPPPCHGGFGWDFYSNNIGSPNGSGFSNFGNPFSMGGGDWVSSYGKLSYQQTLNMQFWNQVGGLPHGAGIINSTAGLFYWNPYAGHELHRWRTGNIHHIQYSGRWISLSGLDRYGNAAQLNGELGFSYENWLNPAANFFGGWALANKGREFIEWEYLRQAKYNRSISGNYSHPVKHSIRPIRNTGRILGYAGFALSGVDIAVNGVNLSNSLDLVMGGIAFIPGFGWAASGLYFVGNLGWQAYSGNTIGESIQSIFTDPNKSWKPW